MKYLLEENIDNEWSLSIVEVFKDEHGVITKIIVLNKVIVNKKSDYPYIKRELLFELND